uniref:N-acetyltransferase ESCO2 n=1 Tax=Doryrhamphus excisus TaxID=161450 RepID=UPI0025ADF4A4|nr:N-acetyltransferase ESCO2 [Doryrhamphus excisus]
MVPMTTRKRKLSSVDKDGHPAKKGLREQTSPVKSSPRKKPHGCLNMENHPSPQKSPRRAAGSPFKPAMVTSSFYGAKKTGYLTPLERKAVKEWLPFPPPAQVQKPVRKSNKKGVRGGKQTKIAAGTMAIKSYAASTKTIKLSKLNRSSNANAKTSPAAASKPAEPKKAITVTFSSLKPKPKIFVGAAFFSTAKKPTSMYKKSSAKPAAVQGKSKSQRPEHTRERPAETSIKPMKKETEPPRTKFDPTHWFDSLEDLPGTPLSSPDVLLEKVITKELKVVLKRTPTAASGTCVSFSAQDDASKPLLDLDDERPASAPSTPPKEWAAVYPIFSSASKRSKNMRPLPSCSTPTGPASTAKERSARRRKDRQDDDQLVIDAGQKQFGATTCSSCGMVYSADNPEDHFQHDQFHQCLLDSIKFVGWKKERVVAEFWDGKILMVMPDDPKYAIKKAEDVRRVADNELGFQQVTLSRPSQAKTYLFINSERMVVGCLVAEPIRQAFRVLEQPEQVKDMTKDNFMDRHRAWCCSTVPEKALCGVSRVWVLSLARRRGIARRMLDTVRSTFMYGGHLTKEEIAFSDPTPDGKHFATAYCGTAAFLVYNFIA